MRQPQAFVDPDRPNYVCKLRKALYGLKQAPRAWYHQLRQYLQQLGFKNSVSDTGLFIFQQGTTLIYILVYADDIIVTGNNTALVNQVLDKLAKQFSLKDIRELSYFLGIEAIRTPQGLHFSQHLYRVHVRRKR